MNARNQDSIVMDGEPAEDVNRLQYRRAFVSNVGGGTMDVENRLAKAPAAFVHLRNVGSLTASAVTTSGGCLQPSGDCSNVWV